MLHYKNSATLKFQSFIRTVAALTLITLFWGCNAQQNTAQSSSAPKISIEVPDAAVGTVYLIGSYADRRFRLDSAIVAAGQAAVFQNNVPYPAGFYVAYYPDQTAVQFLLDGDQEFTIKTEKGNLIEAAQVQGSKVNELLYQSLQFEASQQVKFDELKVRLQSQTPGTPEYLAAQTEQNELAAQRKKFLDDLFTANPDNLFTSFKQAGQNPELRTDLVMADGKPDNDAQVKAYREEFWDNVNFADTSLMYTPVINNKLTRYITQLTPQNAAAIIESADNLMQRVMNHPKYYQFFANWIVLKYEPGETNLMDGEAVYVHMINKYFTKEKAIWADSMTVYGLQQRAGEMAQSLTGQPGPNITVPDVNGNPKTLYDLKAPYLIVYMYNPTCEHCIAETPKLVSFVRTRSDIEVFAVALDTEAAEWKTFIQKFGIQDWTNVYDPSNRSIYKTYFVDHTPELYLLNPERKIIGKNLKAGQVAEVIARDQRGE